MVSPYDFSIFCWLFAGALLGKAIHFGPASGLAKVYRGAMKGARPGDERASFSQNMALDALLATQVASIARS